MRFREIIAESRSYNGNAALLNYFQIHPLNNDLIFGHLADAWLHYADSILHDDDAQYADLNASESRRFADWLEAEGHARQLVYDDPHSAPAWMLLDTIKDQLLPRTTWLAHFCANADRIRQQGFRFGVEDVDRIALTRINSVYGTSERIKSSAPGYNFAYPTDGSVLLTNRWDPQGYGKQILLFQSSGLLVHHRGDQERQVVFWGPSANLSVSRVIEATRWGFEADNKMKSKTLDELIAILKRPSKSPTAV